MKYPGEKITDSKKKFPQSHVISIPNVQQAFDVIPDRGNYIMLASHEVLMEAEERPYHPFNFLKDVVDFVDPSRKIHFQGIVRTKDGEHIIIAGGDLREDTKAAQLFICTCNNHMHRSKPNDPRGVMGTNLNHLLKPQESSELVEIYKVNREHSDRWHCGGITLHDEILVAPLEDSHGGSEIRFLDVANPKKPKDFGDVATIFRPTAKAGSASIIKLPNGKYLCAVWVDSEGDDNIRLDLYLSKNENIRDGFDVKNLNQVFYRIDHGKESTPKFQVVQLLLQDDHRIFVIGTENKNGKAPLFPKKDKNYIKLYELEFEGSNISSPTFTLKSHKGPKLIYNPTRGSKLIGKGGTRFNFRAAGTPYITPEGLLAIYATHHRKTNDGLALQCTEFYPRFLRSKIAARKDAMIELYKDSNYKGNCLRINGNRLDKIEDYNEIFAEGEPFPKAVSSIRFQIPKGLTYELYDDVDFQGNKIELIGTGGIHVIGSIKKKLDLPHIKVPHKFDNQILSSQYVKSNV